MDISVSCKKCTKSETCWMYWNLVEVTNTINKHPSEVFTVSGCNTKLVAFRNDIWTSLADKCRFYNPGKEKYA